MPARDGVATHAEGRRTQTSKGGNRGRCGEAARQTLWGFRRWRSVALRSERRFWKATDGVTILLGRVRWRETGGMQRRSSDKKTIRCGAGERGHFWSRAAKENPIILLWVDLDHDVSILITAVDAAVG